MQEYENSAKSYLAQNLNVIMSIWKMNQHEFAALIGSKYPAFNNYMNLRSFPQVPTLMTISDRAARRQMNTVCTGAIVIYWKGYRRMGVWAPSMG